MLEWVGWSALRRRGAVQDQPRICKGCFVNGAREPLQDVQTEED